jgi:hypothetical protein
VIPAQRDVDHHPDTIGIAKHLIVPKAENAITLILDHLSPTLIRPFAVLASIDFDDELGPMASKIGDEVSDRYLPPEMVTAEAIAQHSPKRSLGIRRIIPKTACTSNGARKRMVFHAGALRQTSPHP